MSASELVEALEGAQPFVYGALFLAAFVRWRRHPVTAAAWLVATFGVLAAVVIAGRILPEGSTDPVVRFAGKLLVAALAFFPYLLYRFMTSLVRPIRWVRIAATGLTAAVAIGGLLLPSFPEGDQPRPAWLQVFIAALLIQWVFLSGIVAVRLWRAGRGQPTVARRRMRTMSLGACGLALALVLGGELQGAAWTDLVVQLLVLVAAPLMLVGFAPPRALRAAWRRHEEDQARRVGRSLMGATTTAEVASALLPHVRHLVGAAGAVLEDADGTIIASEGMPAERASSAIAELERHHAAGGVNGSLVTVPMRTGRLVAVASAFTPFFGHEEVADLEGLADLADLALARNQLLDSRSRLAAIVESSEDAIISKTLDGTITSWNGGASRIYGYREDEIVGRPTSILVPEGREDEVPTILQRIRDGRSIEHFETQRRTKDGRVIDVSLTISPIRDDGGAVIGASTIARDVSERRRIEQERESAREEADRANRAKSEFLSRMSHELRTPLNAVLGFAQLLEMDQLTAEQRDETEEIIKAGTHLLELIDEVLDITRIEAGKLRLSLEPVDALMVVDECVALLRPQAAREGVRLERAPADPGGNGIHLTADRQRLKQVVLNLLSNGIKYNRRDGSVRVVVGPADRDGRIRIDVIDTGHGISPERMSQLFSPFERLGAEGSGVEGTGLGLALSRPLVEAMGGTLTLMSEPGRGTTFTVDLAAADGPAGQEVLDPPRVDVDGHAAGSRTILYVEDNLSNLKLMERLVARRPNVRLVSAMQGGLGLTLALDHRPDLILLDLDLPDLTGEEVLERLRDDPRTATLPIVVITADATKGQRRRVLASGARDYLTKPIDVDRFFAVVDGILGTVPG